MTACQLEARRRVDFEPIGKRVEVASGATLLEAAQEAGIALASACGGIGNCGQCRVQLLAGEVSPLTADEGFFLTAAELADGWRLACSTRPATAVKLNVPPDSLITSQRLQLAGDAAEITLDPVVQAYEVAALPPSLHDSRSDFERLAALAPVTGPLWTEPVVLRQLSPAARQHNWQVALFVRGDEVVGLSAPGVRPVGMAVDLGTTKIAAILVDLSDGKELAVTGALNPQIGYGEDVISRLTYCWRHEDGSRLLAAKVRETLDDLLGRLCLLAGVGRSQVVEVCIVGNTAMTHLLLELPIRQLAMAPFVAATSAAADVKGRDLGLRMAPGAYAHILPGIGGFVGADHVAMILASDLDLSAHVALGIDIGTNTEIVLAKPGTGYLTSASCASGPAFEGAHIGDGMRAAAGAIEAVKLTASSLELKTIDNAPAVGLCGSGILDTVAELLRWRLINQRGRFDRDNPRVREGRHDLEFVLAPANRSGSGRDVVVTQNDVNEIQLAKGAIRAGIEILLDATGTSIEEVEDVILAGAFGSYLKVHSALDIGLLPHFPHARYRQVGNAAVVGARWALLSRQVRERARQVAGQARYLELTNYPKFSRRFADAMLFSDDLTVV